MLNTALISIHSTLWLWLNFEGEYLFGLHLNAVTVLAA